LNLKAFAANTGENIIVGRRGYYDGTAGHVSAKTIKRYIEESQKK
jgi:hypothetical protein